MTRDRLTTALVAFTAGAALTIGAIALLSSHASAPVGAAPSPSASPSGAASDAPVVPRNVILFIGDGMGVSTITAARILEGQYRGESGEENSLSFESFPAVALSKVYNVDSQVPDSAGTITALMSGVKTDIGVINVGPDVVRGQCATVSGNQLTTWMMAAERKGMATGVVTTSRLTDATPAGTYAVTPDRTWENDAALPAGCGDYEDIAAQLLSFENYGDGFEVALGGGRQAFFPAAAGGARADGRDLAAEWQSRGAAWAYVDQASDLSGLELPLVEHLLGLFSDATMAYEVDRVASAVDQPSLSEMTTLAITQLGREPNGFALVVEAGNIDHAHHVADAYRALTDAIELSQAVRQAMAAVDMSETLIMVTADHGDVLTFTGFPPRGTDILTVVTYGSATHAGDDVPVFAVGPGSEAVSGVQEESYFGRLVFEELGLAGPPPSAP